SLAQFLHINWLPDRKEYAKLVEACHGATNWADLDVFVDPSDAIQPLHIVEERFLQLLISKFTVARSGGINGSSFELSLEFDDHSSAIWNQNGKRYLRKIQTKKLRQR